MTSPAPLDLDDLLDRVKSGERLPHATVEQIVAAIHDPTSPYPLYTLLHILGRGFMVEHRPLMESFLDYREDPMITSIALRSLTAYWGLHSDYLDDLTTFARGVDWDDEDDVRIIALSQLGEYAREVHDIHVIRLLVEILDKEAEDELIRSFAVAAVARALGHDHNEMPSAARFEPLDSPWSVAIRKEAADYLADARP
ncbi:MAG: hypothetical protein ACFCVG_00050 [Kineosporiaceae bacterium]